MDTVTPAQPRTSQKKIFPWYQTGLVLVGFAAGILVATTLDMALRLDTGSESTTNTVSAADKCKEDGGRYDRESDGCLYTTDDRGDGCTKNSDCAGWCLVGEDAELGAEIEGECSENFNPKGCIKYMDEGKVNAICLPE